jgi:hypothetical protein
MADIDLILARLQEIDDKLSNIKPAAAAPPPEIINTEELCKRLDISEPTAIKWRRKNKIPFIIIGSSIRYNWPAVIKALESKSAGK